MKRPLSAGCAALIAWFAVAPEARAWGDEPVAVKAAADQEYVRQKFAGGGANPKSESYVFAQGSTFGGFLRDPSLEHTQFSEITRVLAPDLAVQRYYPARDPRNADQIIVVHWGITAIDEGAGLDQLDFDKLNRDVAGYNSGIKRSGISDPSSFLSDLDIIKGMSGAAKGWPELNAQLLGYDTELQKEEYRSLGVASGMTELDHRLREELSDERYFVILMAYDLNSLKEGRKGAKPKLLWASHFSMRAIGHSFTTALPAMGKVAAAYFGRNVDGLLLDAQKIPEGRVEIGEPRAVETKREN
ncbi:MAG TPA: hypothetical protein VN775_01110 [Opitutaceae bacterium]|nr:hypothetical protein [Opitutaceae bacterium]